MAQRFYCLMTVDESEIRIEQNKVITYINNNGNHWNRRGRASRLGAILFQYALFACRPHEPSSMLIFEYIFLPIRRKIVKAIKTRILCYYRQLQQCTLSNF